MVTQPSVSRQRLQIPQAGIPGMADEGTKNLIGAMLAAGSDGCDCTACKLLRKFGSSLSKSLLAEDNGSGNQNPV